MGPAGAFNDHIHLQDYEHDSPLVEAFDCDYCSNTPVGAVEDAFDTFYFVARKDRSEATYGLLILEARVFSRRPRGPPMLHC